MQRPSPPGRYDLHGCGVLQGPRAITCRRAASSARGGLDDEKYTAEDLAEFYRCRWRIETNLRHLKQTMGMDVLRCQTAGGVRKEMLMFALVSDVIAC